MAADVEFEHIDHGMVRIKRELSLLDAYITKVGFPTPSPQHGVAGISVAALGIVHEYGSPSRGIPSRPFMRKTIANTKTSRARVISRLYQRVLAGKLSARQAISQLGAWYAGEIQTTITNGPFEPLKAATVARRVGNSTRPLIDEGILRRSVTHREGRK